MARQMIAKRKSSTSGNAQQVKSHLGKKLATPVFIGLLLFSIVAGWGTYALVIRAELSQASEFETQLVQTVRTQAAVGAFANNEAIVQEVIQGLLATPTIVWARVSSNDGFSLEQGTPHQQIGDQDDVTQLTRYPLYSPVDDQQIIGELLLSIDHTQVHLTAQKFALSVSGALIVQTLVVVFVILIFVHITFGLPLMRLASEMSAISVGTENRLSVDKRNRHDEIGQLCESANHFLSTAEDAVRKANQLARIDPLTELNNRRSFFEHSENILYQAKRYDKPFSVIMIDIDHFKQINDQYGHDVGDKALIEVATRITALVREADVPARIGGEEFALILPETPCDQAVVLAERLRSEIEKSHIKISADSLSLTASFGVTCTEHDYNGIETLLKQADLALYQSKSNGRNRVSQYAATSTQHSSQQPTA